MCRGCMENKVETPDGKCNGCVSCDKITEERN